MTEGNGEVRELPKGWSKVKLGEIIEFEYGKSLTKSLRNESGAFPVLGSSGIVGHHNEYLVEAPVLIIGRKGAVGEVWFSEKNCWAIDTTYFVKVSEFLSTKFIFFLLKSLCLHQYDKSTAIPGLNRNDAYRLSIALPPFAEQQRIVEKIEELLSDLDQGIENLKKAQKQLKVYRQVVLKWAFEGKLTEKWRSQIQQEKLDIKTGEELLAQIKAERENRYQQQLAEWEAIGKQGKKPTKPQKLKDLPPITKAELTELPQLPHGWRWIRVGNLTHKVTVGHVGSMKDEYIERGIPFLRSQNVRENRFDPSGLKYISREFHNILNKSQLKQEDIVIVRSGNVGTACVIPGILEEANCSDLVIIKKPYLANSKLIAYYFNSVTKTRVNDKKVGVALTHFNTQSVEEFAVPFTTFEEQNQIVQEIESRLSICDQLEATIIENLQKAEALRQSILKQAFEGKLVPQDPNDEPAEKLLERIKQEKIKVKKGEQLSIQGI